MYNNAYLNYVRLRKELDELVAKKLGNSREAETKNFLMNELWLRMSKAEKGEVIKDDTKLSSWAQWPEQWNNRVIISEGT